MRNSTRKNSFLRGALLPVAALALISALGLARSADAAACTTAPVITSVTPDFGSVTGGTAVVLGGTGFCSNNLKIWFGNNKVSNANISFVSSTEVDVVTPASGSLGPVQVRIQQQSSAHNKQFRLSNGFTYTCAGCTVSGVSLQFEGVDPGTTSEPNGVLEPGEASVAVKTTVIDSSAFTENPVTGAVDVSTGLTGPQNGGSDITYTVNDGAATYGSINSGATANCGSDCYALTITIGGSGARPLAGDWDATMTEQPKINAVNTANTIIWPIHVGRTFTDVLPSSIFYSRVETLVHNKVSAGTGTGTTYSPSLSIPRNQMAAFISRAMAGGDANVPPSATIASSDNPTVNGPYNCTNGGTSLFSDVAVTDPFCRHIHFIAGQNITVGCNSAVPPAFCQNQTVTRGSMAVFIAKALVAPGGDVAVPDIFSNTVNSVTHSYDCTTVGQVPFSDVPADVPSGTSPLCKYVGYLWANFIVAGTSPTTYSPNQAVTREQMAAFIVNAFQLTLGHP